MKKTLLILLIITFSLPTLAQIEAEKVTIKKSVECGHQLTTESTLPIPILQDLGTDRYYFHFNYRQIIREGDTLYQADRVIVYEPVKKAKIKAKMKMAKYKIKKKHEDEMDSEILKIR